MVSARDDSLIAEGEAAASMQPLVVGVTGHRDLVAKELPGIEAAVRELLEDLAKRFPDRRLQVMSPLAEGADRLVALVAEELGIELIVPLPMPENLYSQDFESSRSWAEFGRLCRYASERTMVPLAPGGTEESISDYGPERNRQYAEAGAWVAARSDILIAIWDGKTIGDLGGTGHVVKFRREGEMPGYVPHASSAPSRKIMFHIACSRNRAGGEPVRGLAPLQTRWLGAEGEEYGKFPPAWAAQLSSPTTAEPAAPVLSEESAANLGYRFPLVIGITGHRDLKADEIPDIRARVRELFVDLQERYPCRKLRLLSPLAEGADRLVANVAMELGMELAVVMPMPRGVYHTEFSSEDSVAEFDALYARANDVFELPIARNGTIESISQPGRARDLQYAQMGVFLSAHCHILLALWDGKTSGQLGGTAQVVRFHHDDIMPGYTTRTVGTQQMLIDDESDLIYHIVCSREGPDGAPAEGFEPLECWWFTNDRHQPRQRDLPTQHQLIFARSSEFSEDSIRFSDRIEAESYALLEDDDDAARLPRGIANINHVFCMADWLAIYHQKLTMRILRTTHLLAFLMGFMFILFSDLRTQEIYMVGFLLFFALAAGVQMLAKRKGWHRKYLDYRTLAEGLRVQFYLSAAGITGDSESKFTHDNFLQTQDPELGWIRNVMRVAGTRCDADRLVSREGLDFTLKEWIGDSESGQLGYYRRKAAQWIKRNRNTERLSTLSLATSVIVILVILFGGTFGEAYIDPLFVFMGSMLLAYGVRQGYAQSIAEKELIKQYEFMLRVFHNAKRRLDGAEDDHERHQILRALGGSCLDEHAEWILMHRDRSIDQSDIWRLSG